MTPPLRLDQAPLPDASVAPHFPPSERLAQFLMALLLLWLYIVCLPPSPTALDRDPRAGIRLGLLVVPAGATLMPSTSPGPGLHQVRDAPGTTAGGHEACCKTLLCSRLIPERGGGVRAHGDVWQKRNSGSRRSTEAPQLLLTTHRSPPDPVT